jgi:hypothetical protein
MIDEKDLAEFDAAIFRGVIVGIGSLVLLFAGGIEILVQCPFECTNGKDVHHGHGEQVADNVLLHDYLNHSVKDAKFDGESVLTLTFDDGKRLSIIPERNGLESYVLKTRFEICPVIVI